MESVFQNYIALWQYYIALWATLTAGALVLIALKGRDMGLIGGDYRRFLFMPWKVATFIVAGASMTLAAPYSGDPTWDYVDGSVMSLLTYLTAPWSVGVVFRYFRGYFRRYFRYFGGLFKGRFAGTTLGTTPMATPTYDPPGPAALYVAFCLALFSASWFYDIYILMRDGVYPPAWFSNLLISSTLYGAAGLFWSLDGEGGYTFTFQRARWFHGEYGGEFKRVWPVAVPFMGFATYTVLWFLWDDIKEFLGV